MRSLSRNGADVLEVGLALHVSGVEPAKVSRRVPSDQVDHARGPERIEEPLLPMLHIRLNISEVVPALERVALRANRALLLSQDSPDVATSGTYPPSPRWHYRGPLQTSGNLLREAVTGDDTQVSGHIASI